MNFSGINYESFADGEGVRVSFFVSGCNRHCPGCFNLDAQDFNNGELFTHSVLEDVITHLKKPYIAGITMLGGEPMEPGNIQGTLQIVSATKNIGKSVWIYSGYTFDELINRHEYDIDSVLKLTDILVDGAFIEAERDKTLAFRGSKNQRIIDVKKSIESDEVILYQS